LSSSETGSGPSSQPPSEGPAPRGPGLPSKVEGSVTYNRKTGVLTVRRVLYRGKKRVPYEVVTHYAVRHLDPDPSVGAPAVRLTQETGETVTT
jgi:hypothetical protein